MKISNFALEITTKKFNKMKKLILTILCFSALCVHASKLIDAITMTYAGYNKKNFRIS